MALAPLAHAHIGDLLCMHAKVVYQWDTASFSMTEEYDSSHCFWLRNIIQAAANSSTSIDRCKTD
jgi:hypothetical protein